MTQQFTLAHFSQTGRTSGNKIHVCKMFSLRTVFTHLSSLVPQSVPCRQLTGCLLQTAVPQQLAAGRLPAPQDAAPPPQEGALPEQLPLAGKFHKTARPTWRG